jgi:hypothetical protein
MNYFEKFLILTTILLAIAAGFLLMAPDRYGRKGIDAISPLIHVLGEYSDKVVAQIKSGISYAASNMQSQSLQGFLSGDNGNNQTNPIESAVEPAGEYGEAQKDVYKKPLEELTR